jgi:hypothetical protein
LQVLRHHDVIVRHDGGRVADKVEWNRAAGRAGVMRHNMMPAM